MENDELKKIKKIYGEGMAKLCREHFPTLIEQGVLFDTLINNFQENKFLSEDIIENKLQFKFKDYINSLAGKKHVEKIFTNKTPSELLSMAGYDLFECKTEEDIQKFKHYFAPGEKICTLDGGRLNKHYVFFAIKHDVDDIKREDFPNPLRQDRYGTSVISIQFTKGDNNDLLITNRYNHLVTNCDATFSNNLDNIIEGLNTSFEKEYNLNIGNINKLNFEIPNYVRAGDGKYYKYNYELNNIYYCPNNIVIHNREITEYDKNKYLLVDYFLIDLENKSVSLCDKYTKDDFINHVKDIDKIEIKKLKTDKTKGDKEITIKRQDGSEIVIKTNRDNQMIGLVGDDITEIGNNFLENNKYFTEISFPSVKSIGDNFLSNNRSLSKINLPSVKEIGNFCLLFNQDLKNINAPMLERVGLCFLRNNQALLNLSLPSLQRIGEYCLDENRSLSKINLPSVKEIGGRFLYSNRVLNEINTPLLEKVGNDFLGDNEALAKLSLASVKEIGNNFLKCNKILNEINAPLLEKVGDDFLFSNQPLVNLNLPSLKEIGENFILGNKILSNIYLPSLEKIGDDFLTNNQALVKLNLPLVKEIGDDFLVSNKVLNKIKTPLLESVGDKFLRDNQSLANLSLPLLKEVRHRFLYSNEVLNKISAPLLEKVGDDFLLHNQSLDKLSLPSVKEIGNDFLLLNENLTMLNLPSLNKIRSFALKYHSLYSNMTVEEIREESKKYYLYKEEDIEDENEDVIDEMPINNSFWNRFKKESLNFINKFRKETTMDDSEQITTTSVQDENSDELNNIIKESLDIKDQLRVTEKHEDKDKDENTTEQIDTQKPKEPKESEENDRLR